MSPSGSAPYFITRWLLFLILFSFQCHFAFSQDRFDKLTTGSFYPLLGNDSSEFSQAFSSSLDDKKIVGLGEATHGTREFHLGFIKLAKNLICHNNFNVVVFAECGFSDTYYLNEYVLTGKRYPSSFNKNQSIIDEDFKEFVEWLRDYNIKRSLEDRVWVLGADILFLNTISQDVLSLANELSIELSSNENTMLCEFAFVDDLYKPEYFSHRELGNFLKIADTIEEKVVASASRRDLNSHEKYLLQSTTNLKAGIIWSDLWSKFGKPRLRSKYNARDSSIFRNIQWINKIKPDAKMVVFAHNQHLEKDYGHSSPLSVRLGHLLKGEYGKKYFVLATEAGRGEFFYRGKISERKDRVGNYFYEAGLQEGILLFEKNQDAFSKFFKGKFTITNGTSLSSGNFAAIENVCRAFDGIYYFPNSSLVTPLVSRDPFEDFIISLTIGDGCNRRFSSQQVITINLECNVLFKDTSCSDNSVYFSIRFRKKGVEFVDFTSASLIQGKLNNVTFKIPDGAETALIKIATRGNSEYLHIPMFEIDGVPVTPKEISLAGKNYHLNKETKEIDVDYGFAR